MVLVVSVLGTPGSGKTTLISALEGKLGKTVRSINVSELVRTEKLYTEYDDDLDACIMNSQLVKKRISELVKESLNVKIFLIETHTPSVLPKKLIDFCLVLECETHVIYDRLTARGYSARKREENVQAEIMQVVKEEATERFGRKRLRMLRNNTEEELRKCIRKAKKILAEYI